MTYIFLTLLSGVVSATISIYFRSIELKKKVILMHKHLVLQIILFVSCFWIFWNYFSYIEIALPFFTLTWSWIYILFSTAAYYAVQILYEYFSGNSLYASEEEMQAYIEKLEEENKF